MRSEIGSQGPQSWQEFLDRFVQLESEEQNQGKKWEDKSVSKASLQVKNKVRTLSDGQRGPYKPEELEDPIIAELQELMSKQEFVKQWRRELIRFFIERENQAATIEELGTNSEYRIITERGSFPSYPSLMSINIELKKYGFILLPVREDNRKPVWEKRLRIYKLKS